MKDFFVILGGMGTMATESYIHLLNKRTPAKRDQDYLNYILVNHATIPDRTEYILDSSKPNPVEDLANDIKQLLPLRPSFFTLPCNTAHFFFDELQAITDIPILHMPREAVKSISKQFPHARRIGVVATRGTRVDHVYEDEIIKSGYEYVQPPEYIQKLTDTLIYTDIKEQDYVDGELFKTIIQRMINEEKCDVVILGCTELSLAQERCPIEGFPIIDGQSVLVDKTLECALEFRANRC